MVAYFANLELSLIGSDACGRSHFGARKLQSMLRKVKLIAPPFVEPYFNSHKNVAANALEVTALTKTGAALRQIDFECEEGMDSNSEALEQARILGKGRGSPG